MHKLSTYLSIFFITLFLTACTALNSTISPASTADIDQMTFMAGYKPQANLPFVGVYIAQEKGFFATRNLNVSIQHSPGSGQHLQLVAQGKVQVTTQDAAILIKRRSDPGLPLVSIGLTGQTGQQAFASLKSSGFTSPKDWENHTVGFKGTPPPELFALIKAAGADINKIQLVNVGFDPRILTEGKVDVYPVYKSNEPFMMQQWGYDIDLWDPVDYGIPSIGLTYVTSEETLATQSDILARFLDAALEGILYAEKNPAEAVEIVLEYAGPETDRDLMRFMLDSELKDLRSPVTEEHTIGWHDLEQWQALADLLVEFETMQPIDVSKAFTNELLMKK